MRNIVAIHCEADIIAIYKAAMLDKDCASRLAALRSDKVIGNMSARIQADYFCMWADMALAEAKAAGTLKSYDPCDVLALACMGMSRVIIEERI